MAKAIQAIVGLGNPGADYVMTRHNVGWWLVDVLARQAGAQFSSARKLHADACQVSLGGQRVHLLKPQTFMNKSGQSVQALCQFYKLRPAELLVVHDELDLPAGTAKLKRGGGHGGHNGLRSVISHVGADFARLRLGIGHPGHKDQVLGYVLKRAGSEDEAAIVEAIGRSVAAIETLMARGWDFAAQQRHTKPAKTGA